MRAALIIFALISLTFIGTIIYTLAWRDGVSSFIPKDTTAKLPTTSDDIDLETLKYQIKLEQKVDELSKQIEKLSPDSVGTPQVAGSTESVSGIYSVWVSQHSNFWKIPRTGDANTRVHPHWK
jgi:hypothetical protein